MRSWQLLFSVVLHSQVLISVWGQDSIGCFVQGECIDSLYLIETSTPQGELQCLEYCTGVEGSNYFSYDPRNSYCLCWENCDNLSAPDCSTCISGDASCLEDECFVAHARVNGLFLSVEATADANGCAEACNTLEDCQWFTYNSEDRSCVLTADREFISDCPTCTYGHGRCTQEGSSGVTSLFTCGGYNFVDYYLRDVEVIDLPSLEGSNPTRTCNSVPQLPSYKYGHFAMWDDGDQSVLCCGGEYPSEYKRCFKYSNAEWIDLGDILMHQRRFSTAVELSDGRYWVTGGLSDGDETSEFYQDGTFSRGPQLPNPMRSHCAVEVKQGFVFMSGNLNSGYEKTAFDVDLETGAFQRLPDMTQERWGHGCGVVNKGDSYDIIVAGGYNGDQYLTHCEIYNTATRAWREGPPLPQPNHHMSSVRYEDTFLLVGGRYAISQNLDTIYQYNQTSETWILRPERLSTPKESLAAVLAGPPTADCT